MKTFPIVASASTSFRVAADNSLVFAAFDITAHGDVPFAPARAKTLHVSNLRLVGRYEGASHHLVLSTADLEAREVKARLKGGGDFIYDAPAALERLRAELTGREIALDMPGLFPQPVGYQTPDGGGRLSDRPAPVRHHPLQRHRAGLCAGCVGHGDA